MSHVQIGEGIISGPGYPADVARLRGQATGGNTLRWGDRRKRYAHSDRRKRYARSDHRKCYARSDHYKCYARSDRYKCYARRNHSCEIRRREFLR